MNEALVQFKKINKELNKSTIHDLSFDEFIRITKILNKYARPHNYEMNYKEVFDLIKFVCDLSKSCLIGVCSAAEFIGKALYIHLKTSQKPVHENG